MTKQLTKEYLNSLFDYDDGHLVWKTAPNKNVKIGSIAGGKVTSGYVKISINKKIHTANRIIFTMFNGYTPKFVGHKDGNTLNNKIENLVALNSKRTKSVVSCSERQRSVVSYSERQRSAVKKYELKNPELKAIKSAQRRARSKSATPKWANKNKIKSIYAIAKWLSAVVPNTKYHVDHVIPLRGKLVSGLHVETNLSIIKASENMQKHNRFEATI